MTTTFKPAKRENVPLLIGLEGASGSGKTYSALLLASGIADEVGRARGREGRVFGIDSERGRMLHYADAFQFMHGEINPPFRPRAYGSAIAAAEEAGADVIVIDSFSHEWEGEGGVKEWADEILAANPNMKPPAQWNIPKSGPEGHKRLVNQMLAARAHIIVCLRSEEKLRMEEVPQFNNDGSPKMWNGKQSKKTVITAAKDLPVEERWQPICEKRFPYEITTSLLLTPGQPGVPIPRKLQEQHRPYFPEGQRIGREAGAALARWALGGAAVSAPQGGGSGAYTPDDARADIVGATSLDDLRDVWRTYNRLPWWNEVNAEFERRRTALTPTQEPARDTAPAEGTDCDGV